jgi:hypothetical protein
LYIGLWHNPCSNRIFEDKKHKEFSARANLGKGSIVSMDLWHANTPIFNQAKLEMQQQLLSGTFGLLPSLQ